MLNHMKASIVVNSLPSGYETADPHDAWLLALADKAQVHYLVTGDKRAGILSLGVIGQAQIVTASAFCDKAL
jgi:predicted nucleic acid-binding protein